MLLVQIFLSWCSINQEKQFDRFLNKKLSADRYIL